MTATTNWSEKTLDIFKFWKCIVKMLNTLGVDSDCCPLGREYGPLLLRAVV